MPVGPRFKRYAKRAGFVVLGLIALDLAAAAAAAVVIGMGLLKR